MYISSTGISLFKLAHVSFLAQSHHFDIVYIGYVFQSIDMQLLSCVLIVLIYLISYQQPELWKYLVLIKLIRYMAIYKPRSPISENVNILAAIFIFMNHR